MGEIRSGGGSSNGYLAAIPGTYAGSGSVQAIRDLLAITPKDNWKIRGACAAPDVDPDAFFVNGPGSKRSKFAEAAAICARCPVIKECEEKTSKEDKRNSFIAGKPPRDTSTPAQPSARGNVEKIPGRKIYKQFCERGHDRTLPGAVHPNYSCVECGKVRSREYHAKMKA